MLTATSPEIVAFMAAAEENRNLSRQFPVRLLAEARRKYVLIDETDAEAFDAGNPLWNRSGRFMVDRETGDVFTIRGYGQRGHYVGTLERLTAEFQAGTATYRPEARAHVETGRSRVASWDPQEIAKALRHR